MGGALHVVSAPGATIQDRGRPGYLGAGLSRGGAADPLALAEGAAVLQQPVGTALEVPGLGATLKATCDIRIALTGAPCPATIAGAAVSWDASHRLAAGETLTLGTAQKGTYAYVTPGGGFAEPQVLGAQSAHLVAGIGHPVEGATLQLAPDRGTTVGLTLTPLARLGGGPLRVIASFQTPTFNEATWARLFETVFTRNPRSNRMGVRLAFDGAPFEAEGQRTILSEIVTPGDIQIAGDGTPFVLLYEHQTTGGYPRIASVIPADLPRAAQSRPGDRLRFVEATRDDALAAEAAMRRYLQDLPAAPRPLIRDPSSIPNLLGYQLVSGVTKGDET